MKEVLKNPTGETTGRKKRQTDIEFTLNGSQCIEGGSVVRGDYCGEYPVTWLPNYLVTWLPSYLVTWLPGYLVTWLPGYLVTWLRG